MEVMELNMIYGTQRNEMNLAELQQQRSPLADVLLSLIGQ